MLLTKIQNMASSIRMTYITCPNIETARKLANGIIHNKLAACVNILPEVESVYSWEGKIENEKETVLFVKSTVEKSEELKKYVRENHPYDEPAFLALEVDENASSGNFISWIKNQVK